MERVKFQAGGGWATVEVSTWWPTSPTQALKKFPLASVLRAHNQLRLSGNCPVQLGMHRCPAQHLSGWKTHLFPASAPQAFTSVSLGAEAPTALTLLPLWGHPAGPPGAGGEGSSTFAWAQVRPHDRSCPALTGIPAELPPGRNPPPLYTPHPPRAAIVLGSPVVSGDWFSLPRTAQPLTCPSLPEQGLGRAPGAGAQ